MSTDIEPQAAPAQPDTSNGATDATVAKSLPSPLIEGVNEEDRLGAITQVEFYLSDANLPFDKFMFMQTSPHLDPIKGPTLSPEARAKAEAYGPGCSPLLLQTVASFKRMRPYSSKFPTAKLAQIIETSNTVPKLFEVFVEDTNGKPAHYIRRIQQLEETKRAGASDRCVYAKGFISEEDLARGEPEGIQVKLEKWAIQWGKVAVLRMRREDPFKKKGGAAVEKSTDKDPKSEPKKWKNSVFIEYHNAADAEKLVQASKEETDKPTFEGRVVAPIMFKIDYVTMKAKEMGLPAPKLNGQRQAFAPTKSATGGAAGGNSTSFNAFKELKAIAAGQKQYVCGPATKSNGKAAAPAVEETREFDYEGNQLQVDKSGALKDPSQLKTFPENLVLGFELKGDAPANHSEARLNYKEVKTSLSEGDLVCRFLQMTPDSKTSGALGFSAPISDEILEKLQSKSVQAGGRELVLRRLTFDEQKAYHLQSAAHKAQTLFCPKDDNQRNNRNGGGGDRGGKRGGGRGRGGRGGGRGGRDHRPRDRNAERNGAHEGNGTGNVDATDAPAVKKRDVEGNVIGAPTTGGAELVSVPEIGRADKKIKVE